MTVEMLDRQPLEVHDVGPARGTAVAQHVGHVLNQLARHPHPSRRRTEGGAVEELVAHISVGARHGPIGEAAGEQFHLRIMRRQRTAQRMVVGWRVSGGVDDVNAHRGKTIGRSTHRRLRLAATFARAALSYWLTVFPRVCLHIARWQRLARRIPDPVLRQLALAALSEKRSNIEGAVAFAAFAPWSRRGEATKAAGAFQAAYNLLDMLGEQPSADPVRDGERLHNALLYALGWPSSTPSPGGVDAGVQALDWYEHHPHNKDGGYLNKLLEECREAFTSLPKYAVAAPAARAAAERIVAFQSLNLSEAQGDHAALEQWARAATPPGAGLQWWETAAAAGSSLGVHALIAAAAERALDTREAKLLEQAYFPWIGGLHSLLDNLIDKHEDEAAGHRSLVEYYGPERAAERMHWMAEQATLLATELPHDRRHTVVLAGMIGNYLSTPEAHSPQLAPVNQAVLATTGWLARPTMLVFELRRLPARLHNAVVYRRARASPGATPDLDNFR
jgi:tetraprenyl-beta-curcumene synthase